MMGAFYCDAANNGAWSLIRRSRLNQTIRGACAIMFDFFDVLREIRGDLEMPIYRFLYDRQNRAPVCAKPCSYRF